MRPLHSGNQPVDFAKVLDVVRQMEDDWRPAYNVAPTQNVVCIRDGEPREFFRAKWGLIPSWAKDTKIGASCFLFVKRTPARRGNPHVLQLPFFQSRQPAYTAIGEWVNFAVSYDGSLTLNNVMFYMGSTSSPLTLVDTLTLNAGPVLGESIPLTLGVTQTSGLTLSSFQGLLDEIRIYGSVKSLESLEATRLVDTRVVPEPSSIVLGLFAAIGLIAIRRWR